MTVAEFILLAPISLFVIINPVSSVPAFLAITEGDSSADRIRMARLGCMVAASILLVFSLTGQYLFSVLGITLQALQIAGGILLFAIGFEMMRSKDNNVRLLPEEREVAKRMDDIAISPLAVPLLCGPGTLSTGLVLQTQATTLMHNVVLVACIPLVYFLCYVVLRISVTSSGWLNPIVLRVLRRVMGLLFATIAVQFVVNGIEGLAFLN